MMKQDAIEAAKLSPAAWISGMVVWDIPLNDWAVILTIVYTMLLIFDKFWPGLLANTGRYLWQRIKEVLHV